MKNSISNVVEIAKKICQRKLSKGDIAVDCTMGNGNDTALLCSLVGEEGRVYAFDIQEQALLNTKKRLEGLNFLERATLILDGHEKIDRYIKDKVQLIIFNLGYLPRGNHEITTRSETTIEAIGKCLELLRPNGVILLIIYPGHENGKLEKVDIHEFTSALNQKEFNVVQVCFTNQINNPPELIYIERVKSN
ncbi:putative S-adenosylmethionine-dependent methyltransferase involved in cell envelope biogenesis [Desulfosporosinus orientis DSM 765]|uniref:Putative S-adenosylmethionine-dependent methyltransferase involved in cell envelope biogenesis n=1 Tax=Desulfosporosinus orientis (strain ATCC 19365 / DSM 765 / NCIMB 8382 / VKM B-1628 / Singapore I) TaxID=768706 RepID=G7WCH7_DESOD|nr:class I SAM-dependent methyltransferase [Desulfosporosinus orientis]AET66299.1 putative S-adenosylmethionine-dependent methyltransferase involved in cell envelope biogenesis [Desulfosporosinus orientis DSM 765]